MAKKEKVKIHQKTDLKDSKDGDFVENFEEKIFLQEPSVMEKESKKQVSKIKKDEQKSAKASKIEAKKQQKEQKKQHKQQNVAREKAKQERIKELLKKRKEAERERQKKQEELLRAMEQRGKFSNWFSLDNAGSIYPSASDKDWNFVYRISVTMKSPVDRQVLQKAVEDILPRFPTFCVKLCHGFFWNYYEPNLNRFVVEPETKFPCQPFNLMSSGNFLIRVLYSEYRISLEVFHAITDGRGALFFMNSLIARYVELLGTEISEYIGCANYKDVPSDEEMEDSFLKSISSEKTRRPKDTRAYKIKGTLLPVGMVNSTEGILSVEQLKAVAKKYNATVSVFLASVIGYQIYKKQISYKKPTKVSVPIDLRSRYGSKSLRNFSSYVNVPVAGENLTFEDVIDIFQKELKNVDDKMLQANINANVKVQKNFFVKIMPLFVKNFVLKQSFNYMGENLQTLALSNIGQVSCPKEFDEFVEGYTFNLGRSLYNQKSVGVVSFKDKLSICISSKIVENETERDIFKMLADFGLDVVVHSNRRDLYGRK